MLAAMPVRDHVIRRGPASEDCNCHGWVFAGGHNWLLGQEVDHILADNHYEAVSAPHEGDLCVYRDDKGAVLHTALVRSALPDGTVLVEGKWGGLGVFLHPADHSPYGQHYAYYRSQRSGHALTGHDSHLPPHVAAE